MGVIATSGLLVQAQPAIADGGAEGWVTEGQSWRFYIEDVIDASGDPFDYSGLTATTCTVYTKPAGGEVVTTMNCNWSTVGGKSRLTLAKDDGSTGGLAGAARSRTCYWSLKLSDATDSVMFWGPSNSVLHIETED